MTEYIERVKKHIGTTKIINNENNFKNVNLYFISCNIKLKIKNDDPINVDVDLRRFMVAGNKILNKNFVLWYCNKFNGIEPDAIESYEINIIDCDVDTINLTVGDYIEIRGSEYLIHKQLNLKNNTPINDLDKMLENDTDDDISNGANYGEDEEQDEEEGEEEGEDEEQDEEEGENEGEDEEQDEDEEQGEDEDEDQGEDETNIENVIENDIVSDICDTNNCNNEIIESALNKSNDLDKEIKSEEIIIEQNHAWWTLGLM
jgi:hypothetical protein